MTLRARTTGPEATRALGAALAEVAAPGDVLLLAGDLGAGKTAFAQGFGRGLGIEDRITSPTFTLARQYESGRLALHHLDVYRLERFSEIFDVGIPELLDAGGVVLVEWGDAIAPALPADYLEVRVKYGDGDDDRIFELRCVGGRWLARQAVVDEALAPWAEAAAC